MRNIVPSCVPMSVKAVAGHSEPRNLGTVGQNCCKKNKTVAEAITVLYCFSKVMIYAQGIHNMLRV